MFQLVSFRYCVYPGFGFGSYAKIMILANISFRPHFQVSGLDHTGLVCSIGQNNNSGQSDDGDRTYHVAEID